MMATNWLPFSKAHNFKLWCWPIFFKKSLLNSAKPSQVNSRINIDLLHTKLFNGQVFSHLFRGEIKISKMQKLCFRTSQYKISCTKRPIKSKRKHSIHSWLGRLTTNEVKHSLPARAQIKTNTLVNITRVHSDWLLGRVIFAAIPSK